MKKLNFVLTVALFLGAMMSVAATAHAGAVIASGDLRLGINDQGHLNFTDGITTTVNGAGGAVGVAKKFADGFFHDATSPGCLCEGWGAAATNGSGIHSGSADISSGGISNITVDSFTSTASTATSIVHLTTLPGLSIKQEYFPSSAPGVLFQNKVTFTNTTGAAVTDLRYTRAMDWDVPPTEFSEFVTIGGLPAANVLATSDNGFAVPNPYSGRGDLAGCGTNINFTDCGPSDHGAVFDFGFGSLADGESRSFNIYYGAADSEADAFAALGEVGAEVYSFGEANEFGHASNQPYIFAFGGVGGTALPDPTPTSTVPEPHSLLLMGTGLLSMVGLRRRFISV